jgi:NADH dehydrogenase
MFLIGFRNRLVVVVQWAWAYLTFQRGARLISGAPDSAVRSQLGDGDAQKARIAE